MTIGDEYTYDDLTQDGGESFNLDELKEITGQRGFEYFDNESDEPRELNFD